MVPRRCRVRRRDRILSPALKNISPASSKPIRSPLMRTSGYPCPWALRHVLLPSPGERGRRAFHAEVTYMSGKQSGPVFRSAHQLSAVVAAVHRTQACFWPSANLGESGYAAMIEHLGLPGQCPAPDADGLGLAGRQRNAVARVESALLASISTQRLSRRAAPAADRLDVRGHASTGLRCWRACITNFRTTEADIHKIVEAMNQLVFENRCARLPAPATDLLTPGVSR